MTRDGTVGRPDATETNLPLHRDASSRLNDEDSVRGLHQGQQSVRTAQQAGHMTANDHSAARQKVSCQAGAIHT